ncbi:hypothetical protein MBLNU459_g0286t1 [Dothideomycetes sp. NU459]
MPSTMNGIQSTSKVTTASATAPATADLSAYRKSNYTAGGTSKSAPRRIADRPLSFDNARGQVTKLKQRSYLMEMPGEIRNNIYRHLFCHTIVNFEAIDLYTPALQMEVPRAKKCLVIKNVKIVDEPKNLRRYQPRPGRKPYRRDSVKWESSLNGILLTCRALYNETVTVLYSNCTFAFADTKRINALMTAVPSRSLDHLTRLELLVIGYGQPVATANNVWRLKHALGWKKTFAAVADNMPNLTDLKINYYFSSLISAIARPLYKPLGHTASTQTNVLFAVQPLSRLRKVRVIDIHIESRERRAAKNKVEVIPLFIPLFVASGNNRPDDNKLTRIFLRNKELIMAYHTSTETAVRRLIQGEEETESFAEVDAAVRNYNMWWTDPVGNTFP